jgi:hypothetical protein
MTAGTSAFSIELAEEVHDELCLSGYAISQPGVRRDFLVSA